MDPLESPVSRVAPLDDEKAVLGSCLAYPETVATIRDRLTRDDFASEAHRALFAAICAVADRGELATASAVIDELGEIRLKAIGGFAALVEIEMECVSPLYAEWHALAVARAAERRRLLLAGGAVTDIARDNSLTSEDAVRQAVEVVAGVARRRGGDAQSLTPFELAVEASLRNKARTAGGEPGVLSWGFADLDERTLGGARKGQLIVVGGRTGIGKSALLRAFARSFATAGATLYASNEMTSAQLADRDLAVYSGLALATVIGGHWTYAERAKIEAAEKRIAETPLHTFVDHAMTSARLRSHARELHARANLVAVVVDYLQLMNDPGRTRQEQVAAAIRGCKALALELDCPVVVGSQLSRQGDVADAPNRRPTLGELRESGEIEQSADIVLLVYRASYYFADEHAWQDARQKGPYPGNRTEIIVAKQRQGEVGGAVEIAFLPHLVTFGNLAHRTDNPF